MKTSNTTIWRAEDIYLGTHRNNHRSSCTDTSRWWHRRLSSVVQATQNVLITTQLKLKVFATLQIIYISNDLVGSLFCTICENTHSQAIR